jgi:NAD(P)-dependent dehydrogenase (short-subunit alcohol dehydrogenase family)
MQKSKPKRPIHPPQRQNKPGIEARMKPKPVSESEATHPGRRLNGKVAIITGGDSGIGRAVALAFANNGAKVALSFLSSELEDARATRQMVLEAGGECLLIPGDITRETQCNKIVRETIRRYGKLDVLVNNAATHYQADSILDISQAQLWKTFEVNVFAMFYLVKAALPHLGEGASIINTASVTAYRGSPGLIDYSATKGAIVSFTRALASNLASRSIRVNAVAPGPVWTPLIVSSLKPKQVSVFGSEVPMKRAAEPAEIAPSYVFLASADSAFYTGQVLHPNGGEIVNG